MASFTGKQIENTYQSILNIGSLSQPNGTLTPILSTITDGAGNDSSLSIGTAGAGVAINGNSSVIGNTKVLGTLSASGGFYSSNNAYPVVRGNNNQVLTTNGKGTLSFNYITPSSFSPSLTGAITTYTGPVTAISIDGLGRVSSLSTGPSTTGSNVLIASANYSATGGVMTPIGTQFNVATMTRYTTGTFLITFANPASNANYRVMISSNGMSNILFKDGFGTRYAPTIFGFRFVCGDHTGWIDPDDIHIQVWSSP